MSALKLSTNDFCKNKLFAAAKILVVDDSATIRNVISAVLGESGVQQIMQAEDGRDALNKLAEFTPDLVILDIAMPNMDGLEFCEYLRNSQMSVREVPIIVMTGMNKVDERMRALRVGVSSILYKPIDPEALLDRVYMHLQESRLIGKIKRGEESTGEDLQIAAKMQEILLPSAEIIAECNEKYKLAINSIYRPSEVFGGDYWLVKPINDDLVAVFMADFSGHGVSSAVYTFRVHKFLREYVCYYQSPLEVLEELNRAVHSMFPVGKYLTCVLGFIDIKNNTLTYSAAGHPPMLLVDGENVQNLDCSGFPLGPYADAVYDNKVVSFGAKSMLIAYSDALIEANSRDEFIFTPESLILEVQDMTTQGNDAIYARIFVKVNYGKHQFDDDMTLLCVART